MRFPVAEIPGEVELWVTSRARVTAGAGGHRAGAGPAWEGRPWAGSGEAEPLRTSSTFLTVRGQAHLPARGPSVITEAHPSVCVHPDPDSLLT